MEINKSKITLVKKSAVETSNPSSVLSGKNNESTRRSRTREISSRYMSPTPPPRRSPSPITARAATPSRQNLPKRAISAERKRPSPPASPPGPSTPATTASTDIKNNSRKIKPDSLWPSTMRSLSVSFRSDSFPVPVPKKEKPVRSSLSDRALKPSSNLSQKNSEIARKKSPLKGKNAPDRSENSKPVDLVQSRLVEQHMWPSRTGGKLISGALNRSVDITDKNTKNYSLRRMSIPLQKSSSDVAQLASLDECVDTDFGLSKIVHSHFPEKKKIPADKNFKSEENTTGYLDTKPDVYKTVPPHFLGKTNTTQKRNESEENTTGYLDTKHKRVHSQFFKKSNISDQKRNESEENTTRYMDTEPVLCKPVNSCFLGKINISTPGARSRSLPTTPGGSRASSPSKAPVSVSRGLSPSRRGVSPAHSRPSSPTRQPSNYNNNINKNNNNNSVLSFIADIKKGKKTENDIEDAHELRLLYNRHLQWRFANARASALLYSQKVKAEKMLYNVYETTSELWDFVIEKRNDIQQLRLRLKLYTVLKEQMAYLEDWSLCEKDHSSSLSHAVEDLRSSILRLPITGGARGDIETVKAAVCSAVDVMRVMGTSISSILARVEGMNGLVSEMADLASRGRVMIDGCENLLASIAALQVEEYSLRTHLLQIKEN